MTLDSGLMPPKPRLFTGEHAIGGEHPIVNGWLEHSATDPPVLEEHSGLLGRATLLGLVEAAGHMVRDVRMQADQSASALAKATGIDISTLARVESGKTSPKLSWLRRIAEATGSTLGVAVFEEVAPSDEEPVSWDLLLLPLGGEPGDEFRAQVHKVYRVRCIEQKIDLGRVAADRGVSLRALLDYPKDDTNLLRLGIHFGTAQFVAALCVQPGRVS